MEKPRVKLQTTDDQFHALHEALDKVRSTSRTVKVDVEALRSLLEDHSKVLQHVNY